MKTALKKAVRMRSDEEIELADLEKPTKQQVLFWDAERVTLMDEATFEQSELALELLGDGAAYLQEGMTVQVSTYQGSPMLIALPTKSVYEVKEVTPLAPGSAKENRDIPGVLTNGVRTRVPKHIKAGDKVVIEIPSGKYLGKGE